MVTRGLHLTPQQQRVFGGLGLLIVRLLDRDILDLESQDYRPDKTQAQTWIPVDDVVGTHVLQMHSLLAQKLQSLVHVLQAMDAHLALGWARQAFTRQDFQEPYQHLAVSQIDVQIADSARASD